MPTIYFFSKNKKNVTILTVVDQLPRLGKRELICLLSFTCNYVVFVLRGFLFLWVLGMGYVILLWHSLSLPYNYFSSENNHFYSCEISQYMGVFVMPVRQYILFSCKRISYTDFAADIFDLKEKIHAFQLRALNLGHFFFSHMLHSKMK